MRTIFVLALTAGALILPACGTEDATATEDASGSNVETVHVRMSEYNYEVARDTFVTGQPYRFVLENEGTIPHEWVVVPRGVQNEEAGLIEVTENELAPGDEAARPFMFLRPGSYDFACFIPGRPGHYEAGMVHPIEVVSSQAGGAE